jgi:hypothetical protein
MPQPDSLDPALMRSCAQNEAFMRGVCASLEGAAQLCARLDAAEKSQQKSEVKPNANHMRIAA